jgi:hypothetical protein
MSSRFSPFFAVNGEDRAAQPLPSLTASTSQDSQFAMTKLTGRAED